MNYTLSGSKTLVLVDPTVPDYKRLIAGIMPGTITRVLNCLKDPITEITEALAVYPRVEALHLVTHGAPGEIRFAQASLNLNNIFEYTHQLQQWQRQKPLEILIYGCRVAAKTVGKQFLQQLQTLTNSVIAATQTLTGNRKLGGDWNLEVQFGLVKSSIIFSPELQAAYSEVLEEPVLVKDVNPGSNSTNFSFLTNVNGKLYFLASDPSGDTSNLWKSDGTTNGTVMLKNIGFLDPDSNGGVNVNGNLYFAATSAENPYDYKDLLWKSDGTTAGTVPVKDIRTGSSIIQPRDLTNLNGTLYFISWDLTDPNDPYGDIALWKTDSKTAGAVPITDFDQYYNKPADSTFGGRNLTNVNGTLYFIVDSGYGSPKVWKSDGTAAGTVQVKNFDPEHTGSYYDLYNLTNVNGILYFIAKQENGDYELWKSDGTEAGTVQVKVLDQITYFDEDSFIGVNNTLYFRAQGVNKTGHQLWKSDGTAAGTFQLKDINISPNSTAKTNVNGTLYFAADDGSSGEELWKSDGTIAGTVRVKDIRLGDDSSWPNYLTNINGTLYFTAEDYSSGEEVWKSDGTIAGTVRVTDIMPGGYSSAPNHLTNVNGTLYFTAWHETKGYELWKLSNDTTPVINGTANNDILTGTANPETINGLGGNDKLSGLAGNDTLNGGDGVDTLDGGAGNDQLKGNAGNDVYIVGTGDIVTESASQGTDLVKSSISYTLPANVENLTLTGTTAINGTGNTLANIITGNTANNILNGSTGADQLKGNTGNDTYVVDNAGDIVTESANAGTDLVKSSVTYTLPANVENLTLTGTTAINGIGNSLVNIINGNTANNTLNGSTGADQLKGNTGNDTYVVDNAGDIVTESANAGTDLVKSSVTYTLPANVENLTLTGTTAINGTGNTLANIITGNTANNTLKGGDGNDSFNGGAANDPLTGGLGADKFIYNTNAAFTTSAVGVDTITDFTIAQGDKIVLDKTTFPKISSVAGTGFSINSEFAKVTSDALAATRAADIVYNSATGALFYNQNGTAAGFGTGGKFLTLTNKPVLTENQFLIQA